MHKSVHFVTKNHHRRTWGQSRDTENLSAKQKITEKVFCNFFCFASAIYSFLPCVKKSPAFDEKQNFPRKLQNVLMN